MKKDRSAIRVHFHPSEHPFVDQMEDLIGRVVDRSLEKWTDFLDPRQQSILHSLLAKNDEVTIAFDGGHDAAERKRAWLIANYGKSSPDERPFALLRITSEDSRLEKVKHSDYLGALLGLGIKREKIGDIHPFEGGCDLMVCRELADYISMQFQQVHRVTISVREIALDEMHPFRLKLVEKSFTVASLRLDAVISDVFQLSRAKVLDPIRAGRCRVNWRIVEDPGAHIAEGDVISLKGFGKCKVLTCDQVTKKGRIRVQVGIYT